MLAVGVFGSRSVDDCVVGAEEAEEEEEDEGDDEGGAEGC